MIVRHHTIFYCGAVSTRSAWKIPHNTRLRRLTLHLDHERSQLPDSFRLHIEGRYVIDYRRDDFLLHAPQLERSYRFDLFCDTGTHCEVVIETDFLKPVDVQGRIAWEISVPGAVL